MPRNVTDVDDDREKEGEAENIVVTLGKLLSETIEAVGSCVGECDIDDDPVFDILDTSV